MIQRLQTENQRLRSTETDCTEIQLTEASPDRRSVARKIRDRVQNSVHNEALSRELRRLRAQAGFQPVAMNFRGVECFALADRHLQTVVGCEFLAEWQRGCRRKISSAEDLIGYDWSDDADINEMWGISDEDANGRHSP
ncbi:hypothetical protein AK812_SmicGene24832 [Symbiodinium microadriaticum]|uniref:Uncharacterized protein n=1 Tax=Symbiodinium microadriaticum TaxID=2951 RepID=A0A1Q9DDP8_SYMMI|nr:hypothetical protein AK812_SmicGene24832 [Symbiodinium microadriaticum]